jgi:hypothetical protein
MRFTEASEYTIDRLVGGKTKKQSPAPMKEIHLTYRVGKSSILF